MVYFARCILRTFFKTFCCCLLWLLVLFFFLNYSGMPCHQLWQLGLCSTTSHPPPWNNSESVEPKIIYVHVLSLLTGRFWDRVCWVWADKWCHSHLFPLELHGMRKTSEALLSWSWSRLILELANGWSAAYLAARPLIIPSMEHEACMKKGGWGQVDLDAWAVASLSFGVHVTEEVINRLSYKVTLLRCLGS